LLIWFLMLACLLCMLVAGWYLCALCFAGVKCVVAVGFIYWYILLSFYRYNASLVCLCCWCNSGIGFLVLFLACVYYAWLVCTIFSLWVYLLVSLWPLVHWYPFGTSEVGTLNNGVVTVRVLCCYVCWFLLSCGLTLGSGLVVGLLVLGWVILLMLCCWFCSLCAWCGMLPCCVVS
jgi:hypothetical protein